MESTLQADLRLSLDFDQTSKSSSNQRKRHFLTDRSSERLSIDTDRSSIDLDWSQIQLGEETSKNIGKKINILESCLLNNKSNALVEKYNHTNQRAKKLMQSSFLKRKKNKHELNAPNKVSSAAKGQCGHTAMTKQSKQVQAVDITSSDLQQICKFDQQLYQMCLSLFTKYHQQQEAVQENSRKIQRVKQEIREEKHACLSKEKQLEELKDRGANIQKETKAKEACWLAEAKGHVNQLRV